MFPIRALCETTGDNCSTVTCCAPVYVACMRLPPWGLIYAITIVLPIFSTWTCVMKKVFESHPHPPWKAMLDVEGPNHWPPVAWHDQTMEGSWKCPWSFSDNNREKNIGNLSFRHLRGMKSCQDQLLMQLAGASLVLGLNELQCRQL